MTQGDATVSVKFNPGLAIVILVCGVINIGMAVIIGKLITVVTGGICVLVGILWLVNPTIVKEANVIKIKNPLGMTLRSYMYLRPSQLLIQGNTILYEETGGEVVKVAKKNFAIDGVGWARLIRAIEEEQLSGQG